MVRCSYLLVYFSLFTYRLIGPAAAVGTFTRNVQKGKRNKPAGYGVPDGDIKAADYGLSAGTVFCCPELFHQKHPGSSEAPRRSVLRGLPYYQRESLVAAVQINKFR